MKQKFILTLMALSFFSVLAKAEEIVDVQFMAPLFCENHRKTISYIIASLNVDSFSKVTDLAYFTDGYPNVVGPDFYSASKSSVKGNVFKVELKKLVGTKASEFYPQKSGPLATCIVTVKNEWKDEMKRTQDIDVFETNEFDVMCSFPLDERAVCKTSKSLAKRLYLNNPYDGNELDYDSKLTYKAWECKEGGCR